MGRRKPLPALAQQVLQRPAELVVSHLKLTAAAASRVARGMSIVWAACGDPVAAGVVQLRATLGQPHRRRLPCAGVACPRGGHLHCPGAAAGGAGSATSPASAGHEDTARFGGLSGYGVNRDAIFRRAVGMTDKLLRHARPADLPVEQPAEIDLLPNARTAPTVSLAFTAMLRLCSDGLGDEISPPARPPCGAARRPAAGPPPAA
jgi:ABC-type uncharacterized transport system substrate-binding protein